MHDAGSDGRRHAGDDRGLGNDSDPDGDTLTVTAVSQGSHGTVAIDAGAARSVYTPDAELSTAPTASPTPSATATAAATARR